MAPIKLVQKNYKKENIENAKEQARIPTIIEINKDEIVTYEDRDLKWHEYSSLPKMMTFSNTSSSILINGQWSKRKPFITGGPLNGSYIFSQIHFHLPSEHQIDGQRFPLEMHAVHYKSTYATQEKAMLEKDGTLIIVYLFQLSEKDSSFISEIIHFKNELKVVNSRITVNPKPLEKILNPFASDYLLYWGSIVSAQASYMLQWIINLAVLPVSEKQIRDLQKMLYFERSSWVIAKRSPPEEKKIFHVIPYENVQTEVPDVVYNMADGGSLSNIALYGSVEKDLNQMSFYAQRSVSQDGNLASSSFSSQLSFQKDSSLLATFSVPPSLVGNVSTTGQVSPESIGTKSGSKSRSSFPVGLSASSTAMSTALKDMDMEIDIEETYHELPSGSLYLSSQSSDLDLQEDELEKAVAAKKKASGISHRSPVEGESLTERQSPSENQTSTAVYPFLIKHRSPIDETSTEHQSPTDAKALIERQSSVENGPPAEYGSFTKRQTSAELRPVIDYRSSTEKRSLTGHLSPSKNRASTERRSSTERKSLTERRNSPDSQTSTGSRSSTDRRRSSTKHRSSLDKTSSKKKSSAEQNRRVSFSEEDSNNKISLDEEMFVGPLRKRNSKLVSQASNHLQDINNITEQVFNPPGKPENKRLSQDSSVRRTSNQDEPKRKDAGKTESKPRKNSQSDKLQKQLVKYDSRNEVDLDPRIRERIGSNEKKSDPNAASASDIPQRIEKLELAEPIGQAQVLILKVDWRRAKNIGEGVLSGGTIIKASFNFVCDRIEKDLVTGKKILIGSFKQIEEKSSETSRETYIEVEGSYVYVSPTKEFICNVRKDDFSSGSDDSFLVETHSVPSMGQEFFISSINDFEGNPEEEGFTISLANQLNQRDSDTSSPAKVGSRLGSISVDFKLNEETRKSEERNEFPTAIRAYKARYSKYDPEFKQMNVKTEIKVPETEAYQTSAIPPKTEAEKVKHIVKEKSSTEKETPPRERKKSSKSYNAVYIPCFDYFVPMKLT